MKRATAYVGIVFIILICTACPPIDLSKMTFSIAVWNIHSVPMLDNVMAARCGLDAACMAAAFDRGQANHMDAVAEAIKQEEPSWNLLSLQELTATKDRRPDLAYELQSDQFPCTDGVVGYAVDCIARALNVSIALADRGIGMIAQSNLFELIPGSKVHDFIGENHAGLIYRTVLGARFRHIRTGLIVPFYSVHLSNTTEPLAGIGPSPTEREVEEVTDLVTLVRAWYVPGDMPPVITGDFNCETWHPDVRTVMYEHFANMSTPDIQVVFVGRPQSFPSASTIWLRKTPSHVKWFNSLSDHPLLITHLTTDRSIPSVGVVWPAPTPTPTLTPSPFVSALDRAAWQIRESHCFP